MKYTTLFLTALVVVFSFGCGAEAPVEEVSEEAVVIVPEGAELELLFTRSREATTGLTEGPAAAPDGSIYFSDIAFSPHLGQILRFDPATGETTVFAEDSGKSNGLTFDASGALLAAEGADEGGRRISRWNVETREKETVADSYNGGRFNSPNDLVLDSQGRIYFSDPRYLGAETRDLEHMAVYRIDTDGTVIEITHEVEKPNGIALSPDGGTMYLADHNNGGENLNDPDAPPAVPGAMRVYSFPLDEDGLVSGPRRTLVDFGDQASSDGMTVDELGNVYLSSRNLERPGVLILNPDGEEVAFIATGPENQIGAETPTGLPSNVEFGVGDESNVLYVTVDVSLYRIPLGVDGYRPF